MYKSATGNVSIMKRILIACLAGLAVSIVVILTASGVLFWIIALTSDNTPVSLPETPQPCQIILTPDE